MLTGLPIDGDPVIGSSRINWSNVCNELLGVVPPAQCMKGTSLTIRWLAEEFAHMPEDADEITW